MPIPTVDETEQTWDFVDPALARFKPRTLELAHATAIVPDDARPHRVWQVSGGQQLLLRRFRDDKRTGTTRETRELIDVPARLAHMDALGIDVQVLYPTMFLFSVGPPDVELALYRAYNRWLARATEASNGRLRWVAMIPFQSPDHVVEELRFAVSHGACGVFKKGFEAGGRACTDELFYPSTPKRAAERSDLRAHRQRRPERLRRALITGGDGVDDQPRGDLGVHDPGHVRGEETFPSCVG